MTDRIPPYEKRHIDEAERLIRDKTKALDGMSHVATCVLLATALADIEDLKSADESETCDECHLMSEHAVGCSRKSEREGGGS